MSDFPIIKNYTFPKTVRPDVVGKRKYPYEDLEVGDSFFIPNRDKNNMSTHNSSVGKQLNRVFRGRLVWLKKGADDQWGPAVAGEEGAVQGVLIQRFPDDTPRRPAPPRKPKVAPTTEPAAEGEKTAVVENGDDDE